MAIPTTTVREAIHERLDPVIEEIVSREISQRGGYEQPGRALETLMPVLLSTLMQQRGQEPQQLLQNILPALSVALPSLLQRGPAGQEPQQLLQSILPSLSIILPSLLQRRPQTWEAILPALSAALPALLQRRPGQEPQQLLQSILPALSAALPALLQRRQEPQQLLQSILPALSVALPAFTQRRQEMPLQTLAPVLVAALSSAY